MTKPLLLLFALCFAGVLSAQSDVRPSESPSRLSDERKALRTSDLPERPAPLIEIGDPFLAQGEISKGFTTFTGAVWRPRLMIFGDFRASFGHWEQGQTENAELILDAPLFANLYLSETERILFSINPFSRDGFYTGHRFEPEDDSFQQFNAEVDSFFFEGDLPELFPKVDAFRGGWLDLGFSVGRQLVGPEFNDGLLINDRLDAFGLVHKSAPTGDFSHYRITTLGAWADVHRGANRQEDDSAILLALLTSSDLNIRSGGTNFSTTIDFDLAYVSSNEDTGDGAYGAIGAAQRLKTGLGAVNTTFRLAGSLALDDETAAVKDGAIFFFESSLTPHGSKNVLYLNGYYGADEFSSAARDPRFAGVLAPVGLAFTEIGLGAFPAALSSDPARSFGAAFGWQIYSEDKRRQYVFEIAGQAPNHEANEGAAAFTTRFQQAFGERYVFRIDGSWSAHHGEHDSWALRTEFLVRF